MYCFFLWKLSANALPTEWCKANQYTWTPDLSNTRDFKRREIAQYVLLSADLSLPSLSDISKVDCTGGKFKLLPEYLTERDV